MTTIGGYTPLKANFGYLQGFMQPQLLIKVIADYADSFKLVSMIWKCVSL